jgi:hypothetical protein
VKGWRYHLVTLGSVLVLVSICILFFAGLGMLAAAAFNGSNDDVVPGRGVTTIPAPRWSAP